jgi:hypothetical protein
MCAIKSDFSFHFAKVIAPDLAPSAFHFGRPSCQSTLEITGDDFLWHISQVVAEAADVAVSQQMPDVCFVNSPRERRSTCLSYIRPISANGSSAMTPHLDQRGANCLGDRSPDGRT